MKKVLFFPQNETAILNMKPVSDELLKHSIEVMWLNASDLYHQYIYDAHPELNKIDVEVKCPKPFYLLSSVQQVKYTKYFRDAIKEAVKEYDAIVIGNDGALQRAAYSCLKEKKLFLIIDSIISDYTFSLSDVFRYSENKLFDTYDYFRRLWKQYYIRLIRYFPYNYYLPSEIGTVKATKTYVMAEHVKEILVKRGLPEKDIIVSGVPRFAAIFGHKRKETSYQKNEFRVLILTGAALWHNDFMREEMQMKQIKEIFSAIHKLRLSENKNIIPVLRIHPRDNSDSYKIFFNEYSYLEKSSTQLYDEIIASDLVLAENSTALIEALALKVNVGVVMLMGQFWRYKRTFLSDKIFTKVFNVTEFEELIKRQINNRISYVGNIDQFISARCENAFKAISDDLISNLN